MELERGKIMKFCTQCGAQVEEGKLFCTKCGQPLTSQGAPAETSPIETNTVTAAPAEIKQVQNVQVSTPKTNIKFSNTQKIIAAAAAGALILLFIIFRIGASLNSRDKVVARFNEAIASKNTSKMAKHLVSSDPKLKIEAKNLDALLSYIDKNPSYRNEISKSIQRQATEMEVTSKLKGDAKDVLSAAKAVINTSDLFTLKKKGKTWLFFDKYVFEINPVYVRVTTNYKNTQIFLGDAEVCKADTENFTKEVGPYLPGLYTMKAVLKGDYVNLEKNQEVDLVRGINSGNENQKVKQVQLYLDGYEISVDCEYDDAKLFANGKDTGLVIKDAKNFGPVSKDGSVKLYAQKDFPWGTVKGEEIAVTGNRYISLKLSGVNEEVKNTLMETLNTYNKSWVEAVKARDASKLVNATEKKQKDMSDYIQRIISYKDMYTGSFSKVTYDLDSMRVYKDDNKYYVQLLDQETYVDAWYKEGGVAPQTNSHNVYWRYTLVYDEAGKKWLVDNAYETYSYYFSPKNKKDFTF